MWNNGNGNGYGQQGYGGDDVYGRMNNAREQGGARFPFIEAGRHKLAMVTLEKFQHRQDGPCARAIFEVLESTKHPVGSFVVKIYKLVKQPKFDSQASDAELLAQMCMALKGAPKGHPIGNDIRVLLEERPQEQLARGTVVECVGVPNQKGTWVNLWWTTVQQTPADIVQQRQRLEQKGIPVTGGQQQGQQMQYPAGAANGYGQPVSQGYAPPQQPGYGQPQMPMAPQGYGQPQMQQQYAPPQQPQYQQPAPQQGAPQGGFLSQLPPQGAPGGNPQGGNGGGRPW